MTAQASAVPAAAGALVVSPCTLRGLSIRDTSGATNTVRIYDNASAAAGTLLFSVQLAGNASTPPLSIDHGLRAINGLFLTATGAIEGSVWVG
jgi:hypothetical protein